MDWILFLQIVILMLLAYLFVTTTITHVIDKRREDDFHRKQNGL